MQLLAKPLLRTISTVLPLFLISFFLFSGTASANAHRPASACDIYGNWTGFLSTVSAEYDTYSACNGTHALVETYINNCGGSPHDSETDTWQTRQTNSGGTRYNETGRSGWVTYPSDCYYYWTQDSYYTGGGVQLSNPSWGCVWIAIDDNVYNALDYQCGTFPRFN